MAESLCEITLRFMLSAVSDLSGAHMNNVNDHQNDEEGTIYGSNVELYDIAFDWDLTDEVTWLLTRLGDKCETVLEPGCGSGRMVKAFAERGVSITGIDISAQAVAFARSRNW